MPASAIRTAGRARPVPLPPAERRAMTALESARAEVLSGTVSVPGDKSISHRAVMLGLLAVGETRVTGLLDSEDVQATVAAARAFGARIHNDDGVWSVRGVGVGGLREPADVLDMGNAGTAARLLIGAAAGQPITCFFTGDASLRRRPMARIIEPLQRVGASFVARDGNRLPLAVTGAANPLPIDYLSPVASAQVKSAVLLAGLAAPGETSVTEPYPSRDHSERMLGRFGASVQSEATAGSGRRITLIGQPELVATPVVVPGDPSSAAFPLVAALIVPGSRVTIRRVGVNPLRTGLFVTLRDMGADIEMLAGEEAGGEPQADLVVRAGPLRGLEVPPERAPAMIDEIPILAVAAAFAEGATRMTGLAELRVKESDRLAAMASGLSACGVRVEEGPDSLTVHGTGRPPTGGATVAVGLDHRIAMAFLVLGAASMQPVIVDDARPIATSFPGFAELMTSLGCRFTPMTGP